MEHLVLTLERSQDLNFIHLFQPLRGIISFERPAFRGDDNKQNWKSWEV